MRIAFYAPLKAPDHPIPSGDRQTARLLVASLRHAGHKVDLPSTFRSFTATPEAAAQDRVLAAASGEVERIAGRWRDGSETPPDLVLTYHLYYKAPDLIGWPLARRFDLPYATVEASHAAKRANGPWRAGHRLVEEAVRGAIVNFAFTANDRMGLAKLVGDDRILELPPFLDTAPFGMRRCPGSRSRVELVTVAMMRPGDKLDSYAFLAAALGRVPALDWRLTVVGDGPAHAAVKQAFAAFPAGRIRWLGGLPSETVSAVLHEADLFVWPGLNEAFGVCYLEAQACGLPVVAVAGQGTPSVVRHGDTGLLTSGTPDDYAAALERFIRDQPFREACGARAYRFVHEERNLPQGAARLHDGLLRALGRGFSATLPELRP